MRHTFIRAKKRVMFHPHDAWDGCRQKHFRLPECWKPLESNPGLDLVREMSHYSKGPLRESVCMLAWELYGITGSNGEMGSNGGLSRSYGEMMGDYEELGNCWGLWGILGELWGVMGHPLFL